MKLQLKSFALVIIAALFLTFMNNCTKDDPTEEQVEENPYGIPNDRLAKPNPEITDPNAIIPNYQFEEEVGGNGVRVFRIDMTGIMDPNTDEWLDLYGTNESRQNIWLSLDDTPKGILVKNHSDDSQLSSKIDLVFLVDNSGSMGEEADAVANDIVNWANNLVNSGIDIQFGCVGYSVWGDINGGIDFTTQTGLAEFLDYGSGTYRTQHFGGANEEDLAGYASNYGYTGDECGVMALRFANDYFSFRPGANRIYVNFTDEPNQPYYHDEWSVEYLNPVNGNWLPQQGTVHTVYSGYPEIYESAGYSEKPWLMSEYTGGTILYANSDFSGVSLDDLPVTGAMQHSYSIYFTIPNSMRDRTDHDMKVTLLTKDETVRAEREFQISFDSNSER
jgi:hypothetical protein